MKRIATTLFLLFLALVATRPASAQSCETSLAGAAFRAGIDAHIGPATPLSKASREQRVAALDGVLPADGPARCLMLAGMNLLPELRLVSADGQLTSIVDQFWVDAAWEDSSRTLLSYTEGGDFPSEITFQNWDGAAWVNDVRSQIVFVDGAQSSFLTQEWDGTDWVNLSRSEFTYDGANLATSLSQNWENDAWVNVVFITYTYDDSGNESTSLTQFWENEAWVDFSRSTTSYDDQGRETESLSETWDETEGAWVNSSRLETVWSGDGSTATSTSQFWGGEEWFNISRGVTTYDGAGRITQDVRETVDFLTGDFTPVGRTTFTYDGASNDTVVLFESWDGSAWVNEDRDVNTFDGDNDITVTLFQVWNGAGWDDVERSLFNYGTTTAREDVPGGFAVSAIDLFPNPTRDRLTIDVTLSAPGFLRVEVYDLLGRRVATLADVTAPAGVQQLRWEASDQPAGLYLVRLQSGSETRTHTVALVR